MELHASAFSDRPVDGSPENGAENPRQPSTSSQRFVAQTIEEVLQIAPVGVADNFYSLGGNSFQLMTLIARVNSRATVDIDVAEVLRDPTVRAIAHSLEEALSAAASVGESAEEL